MRKGKRDAICDALLSLLERRSYDDITVRMVCYEAGCSKQAFYNNFACIDDAIDAIYGEEYCEAHRGFESYEVWIEALRLTMQFFVGHRDIILNLYNSSWREGFMSMVGRHWEAGVTQGIEDIALAKGVTLGEKDWEFIRDACTDMFMGVLRRFFDGGLEDDVDFIVSRCDVMMRGIVRRALDHISESQAPTLDDWGQTEVPQS